MLTAGGCCFIADAEAFVAKRERWNPNCDETGVRLIFFLVFLFIWQADLPGQTALESAKAAQARLGPSTWSRVIRVENKNAHSVYPRNEYALVFEFAGILWFYSSSDGTQSFSLFRGRLAEEKADFGPGLRAIEPGFGAYSVVCDKPESCFQGMRFPNGCLIESIAAARERFSRGERITCAKLVMFYAKSRREGHCVLAYETPEGVFTLDSGCSGDAKYFGRQWPTGAIDLAAAAWPEGQRAAISRVRTLDCPLTPQVTDDNATWASAASSRRPGSGANLADPGHG